MRVVQVKERERKGGKKQVGDADVEQWSTSHVTCYTSHVTCYTLHFTRYMLHFTRYMLHVTLHTLHVTRHTSHVTRHTSHVTRHTSHVTRHTSLQVSSMPVAAATNLIVARMKGGGCGFEGGRWVMMKNVTG